MIGPPERSGRSGALRPATHRRTNSTSRAPALTAPIRQQTAAGSTPNKAGIEATGRHATDNLTNVSTHVITNMVIILHLAKLVFAFSRS